MIQEFKQYASNINIMIKNVLIKTHHSIDQVEQYHDFLSQADAIIVSKMFDINFFMTLQMAFKAINNSINSHGFVSTLFVFDVFLQIIKFNIFAFTISQRTIAIKKAMNEIQKYNFFCQINDVFNICNDFLTLHLHDLFLNSLVFVYCEKKSNHSES